MLRLPLLVLHILALSLWLGCVVTAGLAAAIIFPTMKSLDPQLPAYAGYTGDHWMLAAGRIADRIFDATDTAQVGAAGVALLTGVALLAARGLRARPPIALAWLVALAAALGVLAYTLTVLRPRMTTNLVTYWDAASRADNPAAEAARAAFSAEHPLASNLMAATALLVLLALILIVPAAGIGKAPSAPRAASDAAQGADPR